MTGSTAGAEKPNLKKPQGEGARAKIDSRLARLSLAALGVVFGDIAPARYMPSGSVSTVNTGSMSAMPT